ncbi:MAG: phosphopantetheine-binding protein [Flavobacteriales bacterium]
MENNQEINAFLSFVSEELQCDESLSLSTEFRGLAQWSSLNALLLVAAINERTDVMIHSGLLKEWTSFGDIYSYIFTHWDGTFTK